MAKDNFVNLTDTPYSRRGSYIAFANDNFGEDMYGKCTLWLCSCRKVSMAMADLEAKSNYRQIMLQAVKDGMPLPCDILTTPSEVILQTRYGQLRFCIGERNMVMCRGEDGLGLRVGLIPTPFFSIGPIDMMDGNNRRLMDFGIGKLLLTPLVGTPNATPDAVYLMPDQDGVVQMAMEDSLLDPELRPLDSYPSYAQCVESVVQDFGSFCDAVMPSLPGEFEEKRLQALWQTWNMIVEPDGESDYKRPMVKMVHCIFESAFVWQQPMQAIWLSRDKALSWQVLCSSFDFQDKNGRLTDGVAFKSLLGGNGLKPPVHGLMLLWLMEHGIVDDVPLEEKKWLLNGLIRWTEFFMKFRDKDGDGIFEYQTLLETGWEDAPQYMGGFPHASPDLNAYLALQMEAIAKFGATCGMPQEECDAWMERSKALVAKLVEAFWDGEKWTSFNASTGARSFNRNIALYTPLVLGKRLPQDVIDKSIESIFEEGGFDTPWGLASEALSSDLFGHGFTRGSIITPAQFLMCLGFEACGRFDLAQKVGLAYCKALKEYGFFHIYNALTGHEDRSLTAFGERGLFWAAWASSCYFFMADRYAS